MHPTSWRAFLVLLVLGLAGCGTIDSLVASPDERDWREAKRADTADSYIAYLAAHPDGVFASEARKAAQKFLTLKYIELPEAGDRLYLGPLLPIAAPALLVTSGFGDMIPLGSSGGIRPDVYMVKHLEREGTRFTFNGRGFKFRFGNAILQPRFPGIGLNYQGPGSTIYVYRDQRKGVRLSGFEILLQGTSQSAPVFELIKDGLLNAADKGDLARVKALLGAKANVNAMASDGLTALTLASAEGHLEIVQALIDAKADVNEMASTSATALMLASEEDHLEVVRALLDAKANVNARPSGGPTALMLASAGGHLQVVQALIDAKAAVNIKVGPGLTALMMAAQNHHNEDRKS